MSDNQFEEKIQREMELIVVPEACNLRTCYQNLIQYLKDTPVFSKVNFADKVRSEFAPYNFGYLEDTASVAKEFLTTCAEDSDFALQMLTLLTESLDDQEMRMKRACATIILSL